MRSVKFLVAAGAASLLSSVAFAADMAIAPPPQYYAPPPVEEFGGWYLRGDVGFSNQSVKKLDYYSYPTLLGLNQRTGFDSAGIFGVGVGYQVNNWFRADITGQYRANANFHGLDLTTYPDTGTVQKGSDTELASARRGLQLQISPMWVLTELTCMERFRAWRRQRPLRSGTSHGRCIPVWPTRLART
jgi:opacity protein-like surface antigen